MEKQENTSNDSQENWESLIVRDRGPKYLTFTSPFDIDEAREYFETKFGYPPESDYVMKGKYISYLFLGPVKEK